MGDFLVGEFRDALWTILLSALGVLGILFVWLVLIRLHLKAAAWRRTRLELRYVPLVDALTVPSTAGDALARLTCAPRKHFDIMGRLLLRPLALTEGQFVDDLRAGASAIGLPAHWLAQLRSRHWWERAHAVHALGLVRTPGTSMDVLSLIDDPHEEVRAAAVGALGWLADPSTVPALLAALTDETRHQQVRIVEALQRIGEPASAAVLDYIRHQATPDPVLADLIGHLRLSGAADQLLDWTGAPNPDLRAAAFRALGTLGPDDRAFYHAVKALGDEDSGVCAMAARVLGRTGRPDAVPYLATLLTREWLVAVEAAQALYRLGTTGREALKEKAAGTGHASTLAGHVLWEGRVTAAR